MSSFNSIDELIKNHGFEQQLFSDFRSRVLELYGNKIIATQALKDPQLIEMMARWAIDRLGSQGILKLISSYQIPLPPQVSFSTLINSSKAEFWSSVLKMSFVLDGGNSSTDYHGWMEEDIVISARESNRLLSYYALTKECTYKEMFLSLSSNLNQLCLSEGEIIIFLTNHREFPQENNIPRCPSIISFLSRYKDGYKI
jgi:hypothetical protein